MKIVVPLLVAAVALGGGYAGWRYWQAREAEALPAGIVAGNGRAEATELDVATKRAARVAEVLVDEGDTVTAGQVLARMDLREEAAALARARAELKRAQADRDYAGAQLDLADSELTYSQQQLERSESLVKSGGVPREKLDADQHRQRSAVASRAAARIRIIETEQAIEAAAAQVRQLEIALEDGELRAPRNGRVLYRLAEPGEVLGAGGKVLTLIDLDDTWLTVFLPETVAGRLALGAEARVLLDAFPDRPLPARISFVSDRAQFTPKSVETREERERLSFRVKAQVQVPPQYRALAKPGLPGMAYVKLDAQAAWPPRLACTDVSQPCRP